MYMLLHRSDLNIQAKFRQTLSHFSANFANVYDLNFVEKCVQNFRFLLKILGISLPFFHFHITLFKQILKPNFLENVKHRLHILEIFGFLMKFTNLKFPEF